jgi:hypothetical protein
MIDLLTILTLLAAIPVAVMIYGLSVRSLHARGRRAEVRVADRRPPAVAPARRPEPATIGQSRSAA